MQKLLAFLIVALVSGTAIAAQNYRAVIETPKDEVFLLALDVGTELLRLPAVEIDPANGVIRFEATRGGQRNFITGEATSTKEIMNVLVIPMGENRSRLQISHSFDAGGALFRNADTSPEELGDIVVWLAGGVPESLEAEHAWLVFHDGDDCRGVLYITGNELVFESATESNHSWRTSPQNVKELKSYGGVTHGFRVDQHRGRDSSFYLFPRTDAAAKDAVVAVLQQWSGR